MNVTPVTFYSEGFRLVGDLYAPGDLRLDERRAEIVLGQRPHISDLSRHRHCIHR